MKIFHPNYECIKCMTFVCKKYEPMKEQFSQDFHYKNLGWEVCDMIMLTYDSSNSN